MKKLILCLCLCYFTSTVISSVVFAETKEAHCPTCEQTIRPEPDGTNDNDNSRTGHDNGSTHDSGETQSTQHGGGHNSTTTDTTTDTTDATYQPKSEYDICMGKAGDDKTEQKQCADVLACEEAYQQAADERDYVIVGNRELKSFFNQTRDVFSSSSTRSDDTAFAIQLKQNMTKGNLAAKKAFTEATATYNECIDAAQAAADAPTIQR